MDTRENLAKHLAALMTGGEAHITIEAALGDIPPAARGARPGGSPHSPWQLLEHMRLAQWDILEFTRDPNHVSPEFPAGYWPATEAPPGPSSWDESVASFLSDRAAMIGIVEDSAVDLYAPLPHGTGQTPLREALLIADHNAYHLGQFVLLARMLAAEGGS